MTSKHSAATVAAIIQQRIESDVAEHVLTALKPCHGQLITTRLLDKLPGGRVEWRLTRNYGWTEVKNRAYLSSQGGSSDGVCLMLVRTEASVPLDVTWVERENPAYFAGRRERNAQRAQALADTGLLERFAFVLNEIEDVRQQLAVAREQFAGYVNRGPLSPDRYEFERACGLREKEK